MKISFRFTGFEASEPLHPCARDKQAFGAYQPNLELVCVRATASREEGNDTFTRSEVEVLGQRTHLLRVDEFGGDPCTTTSLARQRAARALARRSDTWSARSEHDLKYAS
jgi:hypothetical protein